MQDGQYRRELSLVDLQMRGQGSLLSSHAFGLLEDREVPAKNAGSEIDAASVLFPVTITGRVKRRPIRLEHRCVGGDSARLGRNRVLIRDHSPRLG